MCGVGSSIWEISAPSSQFPCEPTSTVKKKKKKVLVMPSGKPNVHKQTST